MVLEHMSEGCLITRVQSNTVDTEFVFNHIYRALGVKQLNWCRQQ